MKESEVAKMLSVLRAAFPEMKNEAANIDAWTIGMRDLPVQTVRQVVSDWIMDEEWPPKIAQIRKRTLEASLNMPSLDEAWMLVCDRVRNTYPGMLSDTWNAPAAVQQALRDVGGIREVRMSERPEDMRKRFTAAYERQRDAAVEQIKRELAMTSTKELA